MKKIFPVLCVIVPVLICFSSCMDVNITLPDSNIVLQPQTTAPVQAVVTLPQVETTVPVIPETTVTAEITTLAPAEETTALQEVSKTPLEMSDGELLEWFNANLNNVKESMPGFERAKLTTVSDIVLSNQAANTLVGFVKSALLSEETETKTATKGNSCVEIMTPDGERYVSNLFIEDIKDIEVATSGTSYVVTVTLPDAKNPTRDMGAYSKIFNFITVDDVVNTYAPKVGATVERNNIEVSYSGCYAKATFSPDGKVENYETYVTCVMSLKDASIKKVVTINTDVDITLVSVTNFTNFSY